MAKTSSDEQPKQVIAQKVVTPKRKYFNPTAGEVEADTPEEAVQLVEAKLAITTNDTEKEKGR